MIKSFKGWSKDNSDTVLKTYHIYVSDNEFIVSRQGKSLFSIINNKFEADHVKDEYEAYKIFMNMKNTDRSSYDKFSKEKQFKQWIENYEKEYHGTIKGKHFNI